MYQLFRSLAYIHSLGICHRDIKPQNLLLDPESGVLKLCDFGSAKHLVKGEPNVSYICSRYYRAPELIFGAIDYTTKIGMFINRIWLNFYYDYKFIVIKRLLKIYLFNFFFPLHFRNFEINACYPVYRCLERRLRSGRIIARPTDIPRGQWSGSIGRDHQGARHPDTWPDTWDEPQLHRVQIPTN